MILKQEKQYTCICLFLTVIDLTSDSNESEDIQKAIAASLQDSVGGSVQETSGILGGQVSREEQDISR